MTTSLCRTPPSQIVAGDSIEFLFAIPDAYAGWAGAARLTGPDNVAINATSCATEGTDFHVIFAAAQTDQKLVEGHYALTIWAKTGEGASARRATLAQFRISIQPDLSTGAPEAPHAVQALAAIEKALRCRYKGDVPEEYIVDGVSVKKMTIEDLEKKRNKYAAEVSQLNNPNGSIGRIPFAFSYAGMPTDFRRRFT